MTQVDVYELCIRIVVRPCTTRRTLRITVVFLRSRGTWVVIKVKISLLSDFVRLCPLQCDVTPVCSCSSLWMPRRPYRIHGYSARYPLASEGLGLSLYLPILYVYASRWDSRKARSLSERRNSPVTMTFKDSGGKSRFSIKT